MNIYFSNKELLENTLLKYFYNELPLKLLNKKFSTLNYENFNTHLQPHGVSITLDPIIKIARDKKTYKNGILNGLSEKWNSNNVLIEKSWYKNGELNGLYESYHINGELWERKNYKDGKLHGLSERWYDNNQLWENIIYIEGQEDGLYQRWYKDGELSSKVNFNKISNRCIIL